MKVDSPLILHVGVPNFSSMSAIQLVQREFPAASLLTKMSNSGQYVRMTEKPAILLKGKQR
jgi:hypothetical protein